MHSLKTQSVTSQYEDPVSDVTVAYAIKKKKKFMITMTKILLFFLH